MEPNEIRTTETSQGEGRLRVGASCSHGRKKCLKCVMKKDGKGGSSIPKLNFPISSGSFGATAAQKSMTSKPHRVPSTVGGVKMKGVKSAISSIRALNKKMKFGKAIASWKPKKNKGLIPKIKS
jgi:hypothetical protein